MDSFTESKTDQWDSYFPALNLWNYNLFDHWIQEFNVDDQVNKDIVVIPSK